MLRIPVLICQVRFWTQIGWEGSGWQVATAGISLPLSISSPSSLVSIAPLASSCLSGQCSLCSTFFFYA